MKLIAFSDLHVHRHRFGASVDPKTGRHSRLQDCLDVLDVTALVAHHHSADLRVFCGDLFHVRGHLRPTELNPVLDHFRRVHSEDWKPGYDLIDWMIPGNHDMEGRADGEHALDALKPIPGISIFEGFGYEVLDLNRVAGLSVGLGWIQYAPDVPELIRRVDQVAAKRRTHARQPTHTICLIHHGVDGSMAGIPDMGFGPQHLPTADFDLVLCGDYHTHKQLAPNAWMLGAPLQHTFGDAGQTRGYSVIELEPGRPPALELVEVPGVPKFVTWDAGDAMPRDAAGNFVRVRADDKDALARMRKIAEDAGALAVQDELVRSMAQITRTSVSLTMKTSDLFRTWLDGQMKAGQYAGHDAAALAALNDACLVEAGVS